MQVIANVRGKMTKLDANRQFFWCFASDYGNLELFGTDTGIGVSRNQGIITLLGKF